MVTRQAINAACVALDTPLVTASAVGLRPGQLMVLTPPWTQGCYRCLWPRENDEPQRNCRTAGIVGPVVGMMGTLQALETIKLLSGMATPRNTLRVFESPHHKWRALSATAFPELPGVRRAACRSGLKDEPLACADNLSVPRPADPARTAAAWRCAGAQSTHPAARPVGRSSLAGRRSGPAFF